MAPDRGSVLLLMPAAVLVLVVLAAICVDFSIAFLGEREVANAAGAAANDVAAHVDADHYRRTGEVRIRCDEADAIAEASFAARTPSWLRAGGVRVTECAGDRVTVEADAEVGYVFSRAIPGAADRAQVHARSSAVAVDR